MTFRTADSLPREVLVRMQRELEAWLAAKNLPMEIASSIFGVKLPNYDYLLEALVAADRKQLRKLAGGLVRRSRYNWSSPTSEKVASDPIVLRQP